MPPRRRALAGKATVPHLARTPQPRSDRVPLGAHGVAACDSETASTQAQTPRLPHPHAGPRRGRPLPHAAPSAERSSPARGSPSGRARVLCSRRGSLRTSGGACRLAATAHSPDRRAAGSPLAPPARHCGSRRDRALGVRGLVPAPTAKRAELEALVIRATGRRAPSPTSLTPARKPERRASRSRAARARAARRSAAAARAPPPASALRSSGRDTLTSRRRSESAIAVRVAAPARFPPAAAGLSSSTVRTRANGQGHAARAGSSTDPLSARARVAPGVDPRRRPAQPGGRCRGGARPTSAQRARRPGARRRPPAS
jgi:hypothetical protein